MATMPTRQKSRIWPSPGSACKSEATPGARGNIDHTIAVAAAALVKTMGRDPARIPRQAHCR
jgi:hypothetical protein